MKLSFHSGDILKSPRRSIAFLVYENRSIDKKLKTVDKALNGALTKLKKNQEFTGKFNTSTVLPSYGSIQCDKVVLIGAGKEIKTGREAYISGYKLTQTLKANHISQIRIELPFNFDLSKQFLLGALNADYSYSLKSQKPKRVNLELQLCGKSSKNDKLLFSEVTAINKGVALTRDLVSSPANYATPRDLARAAQALGRQHKKVRVKILGLSEIKRLKMGGLLAVSQGSREEPRFIVIEYKGGPASLKPLVYVGKGLTFDAGGISLKPSANMDAMKWDMGGGGAVIGALDAIAGAGYRANVIGLVPSSENLPDGAAYKPSDVLTMMSGKTVEITNTDAEGRLILADALAYACKNYEPRLLVDMATLTGACAMFLGDDCAGLMTPNEQVAKKVLDVSEQCWDALWRLPVFESHNQAMKSPIADLVNSSRGRKAGASTAAAFLQNFVDQKVPWAHVDIAGVAWQDAPAPGKDKGATGFGVQLLAALAQKYAK